MANRSYPHHWFLPNISNNQRPRFLHSAVLTGITLVVVLIQGLIIQTSQNLPSVLGYAASIPSEQIITITNVKRSEKGLSQLVYNKELSIAAAEKAKDMFAKDYWAHVSPTGTQPWFFITQAGYSYRYAGENLARDFTNPESVVEAWIASPSHRENLFNNKYIDIGVAVADGKLGGKETTLVVQMFGTNLNSTGNSDKKTNNTAKFEVKAATAPEQFESMPALISPFTLNQALTVVILFVIGLVLIADIIIVNRKNLVRWTSKSPAHLMYIITLLICAVTIVQGQIK